MEHCDNWDEESDECLNKIPFHDGEILLEQTYVYETKIGEGGYGCVKCGYRRLDHCSVAIKVIPTALVNEWHFSKMLQRNVPLEVLLLSLTKRINGVVSILEYYEDRDLMKWYIVMERCSKTKDLFEYITSKGYLQEVEACDILYQLLIIIIDCHLLGVVHRDIKEENILIDTMTKKVWLIDFGSGCLMRDDRHVTYNGTLAYSPPEWLRFQHYRGCQLECWTLGIVLYSMVCGSIPFEDEEQILSGVVGFPRKLSKHCVELILRCLEPDPELRIQPFEMITHAWVTSTLGNCDSGRSSFDEALIDAPRRRKSSCSCGEYLKCQTREEECNTDSAIESVSYNQDCIKQIDPDLQFKVISKSLSLDIDRGDYLSNGRDWNKDVYRSTSYLDCSNHSGSIKDMLLPSQDNGYDEDIDDNFQLEEEQSLVISNEEFF